MLTLAHDALTVTLLDPGAAADRPRLGTRYCWGGYIWQVTDAQAGPLVTGPEWPETNPLPFNGQGLPESFRHAEFGTGRPLLLENGRGFIIGIGEVAPDASGALAVTQPCPWTLTRSADAIDFCTAQSGLGYGCQLTRRIALAGRTLSSTTSLTNTGDRPLPLHWFAHPFFALTDRLLTCGLPANWGMAENIGYAFAAPHRLAFKRRFLHKDDGHFEKLLIGENTPLHAALSHPQLAGIVFSTDFTPDLCPVWGNSNTWSIEPYIQSELAPGATRAWTLRYEFGPVV
ncbi:MAG: hypothetical protein KA257_13065 [Opitutaceae bacterium]|nr:hypothetical protein [Opitutaceae bacterium]MBP9914095.1 hypothetical protein [Opitutaceae bacterium]